MNIVSFFPESKTLQLFDFRMFEFIDVFTSYFYFKLSKQFLFLKFFLL